MTYTHTFAEMTVSPSTFHEIAGLLKAAGYDHAFLEDGYLIDMHGIAIRSSDSDHKVDLHPNVP